MKVTGKIIGKSILLLIIFCVAWVGCTKYFRSDSVVDRVFHEEPKNSFDIIALGSSHTQCGINPAVIYTEQGYYAYTFGSGCQRFDSSYYMLEEALKTQKPEVVVLDVFSLLPGQSIICYEDSNYYVASQQMTGFTRFKAAWEAPKNVRWDYALDLRMYHNNWKYSWLPAPSPEVNMMETSFGWQKVMPKEFIFQHVIPEPVENVVTLTNKDKQLIDRINKLCEENDIQLILIKTVIDCGQEDYDKLYAIWDYADEKGILYIDFMEKAEEIGFTLGMDGDLWHNNAWGADLTSAYLANYIQENNLVKNHEDNDVIEQQMSWALQNTASAIIPNRVDPYELLSDSAKYPMIKIIQYNGSPISAIGEYESGLLNQNGFEHDFVTNAAENYYALVVNNDVTAQSSTGVTTTYDSHEFQIDETGIFLDGEKIGGNNQMEIDFLGVDYSWLYREPIDFQLSFWNAGCEGWVCEKDTFIHPEEDS